MYSSCAQPPGLTECPWHPTVSVERTHAGQDRRHAHDAVHDGQDIVASFRDVFFYFADLVTRPGQTYSLQAVKQAKEFQEGMEQAGLSIEGMESALRAGLSNGDFADEIEDVDEWLSDEELINVAESGASPSVVGTNLETLTKNLQSLVKASKTEPKDEPVVGPQSSVTTLVIASAAQPQAEAEPPTVPTEADAPNDKPAAKVKPLKLFNPRRSCSDPWHPTRPEEREFLWC